MLERGVIRRPKAAPSYLRCNRRARANPDWEPDVPFRILNQELDCTVFLYPDEAAAKGGSDIGGSGFIVGVPIPEAGEGRSGNWLVTNKHVIEHGAWTVR